MTDFIEEKKSKRTIIFLLLELLILLILPLPFLNLNIIYVLTATLIMLLSKYLRKEKWSYYGFRSINSKELLIAITIGIAYGFADNYLIEPLITKLTGAKPDLSSFEGVKGNIWGLIGFLALGWVIGGVFEEFFYRGYIFYRLSQLIHSQLLFKCIAISITSIVFGLAHYYQGPTGIIDTTIFAVVMGSLYFYFGRNIWYLIIIHGFFDTVGIFIFHYGV